MKEQNHIEDSCISISQALRSSISKTTFKIATVLLCAFVFCKFLSFVVNALFFGTVSFGDNIFFYATRETSMIWSWWGYAFVGVIDLVFAAVALVSLLHMIKTKDATENELTQFYTKINVTNRLIYIEALLATADSIIIVLTTFLGFFFTDPNVAFRDKSLDFLENVSTFCDLPRFYEMIHGVINVGNIRGFAAIAILSCVNICIVLYSLIRFFVCRRAVKYFEELTRLADRGVGEAKLRNMRVLLYAFAVTVALWSVILFANGSFIAGLVAITNAAFVIAISIFASKSIQEIETHT